VYWVSSLFFVGKKKKQETKVIGCRDKIDDKDKEIIIIRIICNCEVCVIASDIT
jgi:hypothetical protein